MTSEADMPGYGNVFIPAGLTGYKLQMKQPAPGNKSHTWNTGYKRQIGAPAQGIWADIDLYSCIFRQITGYRSREDGITMMKLGEKQILTIDRLKDFGAYLTDGESSVLLPKKELPEGCSVGDELEVFLYKDSADRLIATLRESRVTLHKTALLKVREVSKIGAFLDWGLEKDLLLPFHEQTRKIKAGEEVLAALYIDKSGRLAATMNVYPYLRTDSPYLPGQTVHARIYEKSDNFGVFAAVDDCYSALIPRQEAFGELRIGDIIEARVTKVREDGKLNLAVREKAYLQLDKDGELILKVIDEYDGVLPFDDKVSPEIILREFGLSKNAFKRAVGHLMKNGQVCIRDRRIYRVNGN